MSLSALVVGLLPGHLPLGHLPLGHLPLGHLFAQGAQRLVLESREGESETVDAAGLSLADPRERGAWLVRPLGFEPLATGPEQGARVQVELAGGDELLGRIAGGEGEALELALLGGVRLEVSISAMRSLVLPEHLPEERLAALEEPEEGDRLFRRAAGGLDRIDGTVESFVPAGVRFDSVLGPRTFPWEEVAALFVEVLDGPSRPPADGAPGEAVSVVVDLVDGGRLRGSLLGLSGSGVELEIAGAEVALEWGAVHELLVDDGQLTFLSQLPPEREEGKGTPFDDEVGMLWEHRVDGSVVGGPLVSGGRVFRRGIGSHAPTRLHWRLDGGWRLLRGAVGIDDSALANPRPARGSVVFRVLGDGEELWESGVVRGGEGTLDIPPLALSGVTELVLEADPAGDFRGDRANWLRILLVR